MIDHNNGVNDLNEHSKDNAFHLAWKKVLQDYLTVHTATCSMACKATGISSKSATRYKRMLEKAGLLIEVREAPCQITRRKAAYLSCDPEQIKSFQLKLKF